MSRFLRLHVTHSRPNRREYPVQIYVNQAVPALIRIVLDCPFCNTGSFRTDPFADKSHTRIDPGIGEHDIQLTIGPGSSIDSGIERSMIGYIDNLSTDVESFITQMLRLFIDPFGIMLLTLPFFFPLLTSLGFDGVWFGVIVVVLMQVALLTPPVGVTVYIIAGTSAVWGIEMSQVFRACIPFILLMAVCILLYCLFPEIVLWLPGTMR